MVGQENGGAGEWWGRRMVEQENGNDSEYPSLSYSPLTVLPIHAPAHLFSCQFILLPIHFILLPTHSPANSFSCQFILPSLTSLSIHSTAPSFSCPLRSPPRTPLLGTNPTRPKKQKLLEAPAPRTPSSENQRAPSSPPYGSSFIPIGITSGVVPSWSTPTPFTPTLRSEEQTLADM